MPSVRRTAKAEEDLVDLWLYIAQDNTDAADRLLEEPDRKCALVAENPAPGRERPEITQGCAACRSAATSFFFGWLRTVSKPPVKCMAPAGSRVCCSRHALPLAHLATGDAFRCCRSRRRGRAAVARDPMGPTKPCSPRTDILVISPHPSGLTKRDRSSRRGRGEGHLGMPCILFTETVSPGYRNPTKRGP